MITQKEITDILLGYKNIQMGIDRLSAMLNTYECKRKEIEEILDGQFPGQNLTGSVQTFLDQKSNVDSLKADFPKVPGIEETISDQYKTFLQAEVIQYNPETLYMLSAYKQNEVYKFLERQKCGQICIYPDDKNAIEAVKEIPHVYPQHIDNLLNLRCKIHIFDQIKNIHGSIVMIGANGSGKSTFARQLNGKISNNIIILSAQHFLYYSKSSTLSMSGDALQRVHDFQKKSKLSKDRDFQQLIISDMNDLISGMMAQHTDCALEYYSRDERHSSYLEKTIDIWDKMIEQRHLEIDRTGLHVMGNDIKPYDFNELSDGEKAVFYYVAHILLAPENSYIIVDEPENHLHLTICNKLWDELERKRADCKFIYLTHNLDFATTRSNCTILWNKKFIPPYDWEFEILPEDETIPEVLIMELVGSRKSICFCEGNDKSSLDYKLYSVLFPQYTIIPVGGHRNVIDYVEAYNNIPSFTTRAVGIIDGDHHLEKQIEKWRNRKIYTLPINEIENILCDDYILQRAIETFCADKNALDEFHAAFWSLISNNCEQQATAYVNEYVNNQFKDNFLHEKQNIANLIGELKKITSVENIEILYNNTIEKINNFIKNKDYAGALRFVNFKGRLTKDIAKKIIVDKYENRILDLIKKDGKLQKYICDAYFQNFDF